MIGGLIPHTLSRKSTRALVNCSKFTNLGVITMETAVQIIKSMFNLSTEQQIFITALVAMLVAGLALYVVLAALKNTSDKGGSK